MSTTTRRRVCTPPASASTRKTLSVDVLLEIVACSDVTTIVRWAATGKVLRRAILEPAFHRRLVAAGFQFDPALLFAVSYESYLKYDSHRRYTLHVVHTREPSRRRADEDAISIHHHRWFKPVAARDVLLLRWCDAFRVSSRVDLHVCNMLTGQVTELPLATVSDVRQNQYVLLSVGDVGGSFEVLVADDDTRFQIFSSKQGRWGVVRQASVARHRPISSSSLPAIIGRTVYWLVLVNDRQRYYPGGPGPERILALNVDAAEATMMKLPQGCISSLMPYRHNDKHLLLASVRGQLSLLVTESLGITMWTLTSRGSASAATWNRQLVIGAREILRQAELEVGDDLTRVCVDLEGLGEKSGSLILFVGSGMPFRLDLGINKEEAPILKRLGSVESLGVKEVFLHEIDRSSLLQAMKSF
ncbi:hypothetical protein CFC21_067910 [Triticum aestivum]|uniref:DUF7595 domain-containing protein n=2 Tax=Triticum aestivum TaxID=4565 RepID=A0A9R1KP86_WHEAT|nr:hypothetical protein CFC21_067910 [Triticum aestivum]